MGFCPFFMIAFLCWFIEFGLMLAFLFSRNPNRVLGVLMRRTTGGRHGWNLCWGRASLFNASCMLTLTRANAICIAWTAWMELSVLSVWAITRIIVLFRFDFLAISLFFLLFLDSGFQSFVSNHYSPIWLWFLWMNGGLEILCFYPVLSFESPLFGSTVSSLF